MDFANQNNQTGPSAPTTPTVGPTPPTPPTNLSTANAPTPTTPTTPTTPIPTTPTPSSPHGPAKISLNRPRINILTESQVESPRERAEKELAAIQVANANAQREAQRQKRAEKAKKSIPYLVLVVIGVILLISFGWMSFNILIAARRPAGFTPKQEETKPDKLAVLDGYKCKTKDCAKVVKMTDGRLLMRDSGYFFYNQKYDEAVRSTIPAVEYKEIIPFVWGKQHYLVLDPETDQSAIFAIADNRMLTGNAYDTIFTNPKDPIYNHMNWVFGSYIIAKNNNGYSLIELKSGDTLVRGNYGVFVHDNLFFGLEENGVRRAFNRSGDLITSAPQEAALYVLSGDRLVRQNDQTNDMVFYNSKGKELYDDPIRYEYDRRRADNYIPLFDKDPRFYKIPPFKAP